MTTTLVATLSVPVWGVVVAAAVVLGAIAVAAVTAARSVRRDAESRIETADARAGAMQARLEELEARVLEQERAAARTTAPKRRSAPVPEQDGREFVITSLADQAEAAAPRGTAPTGVADQVVREGLVQTASFVQGVRRALSPEVRNRIRFEMKRELKRSRKARKVELREALREYRARHRADVRTDQPAEPDQPTQPDLQPARVREDVAV